MWRSTNHDYSKLPICRVVDADVIEYQQVGVRLLVVTWNLQGVTAQNVDLEESLKQILSRSHAFDVVVVGFQEIVELKVDRVFQMFKLGNRANEWEVVLRRVTRKKYCQKQTMLSLGLFILTDEPWKARFYNVPTAALGLVGTKGAVSSFLYLQDIEGPTMTLCFINCHLSSSEKEESVEDRRLEAMEILHRGAVGDPVWDHCDLAIFFGDMNMRIAPRLDASEAYRLAQEGNTEKLLANDEFREQQRLKKEPYVFLDEAPISFPPTYKYDGAMLQENRVCAYCDRVMYMRSTARVGKIDVTSYSADMTATLSDHKPVLFEANIQVGKESAVRAREQQQKMLRNKDTMENMERPRVFVTPTNLVLGPKWKSFRLCLSGTARSVSIMVSSQQQLVKVKGRPLVFSMDDEDMVELWSGGMQIVEFSPVTPGRDGEEVIIVQAEGGNCVFVTLSVHEGAPTEVQDEASLSIPDRQSLTCGNDTDSVTSGIPHTTQHFVMHCSDDVDEIEESMEPVSPWNNMVVNAPPILLPVESANEGTMAGSAIDSGLEPYNDDPGILVPPGGNSVLGMVPPSLSARQNTTEEIIPTNIESVRSPTPADAMEEPVFVVADRASAKTALVETILPGPEVDESIAPVAKTELREIVSASAEADPATVQTESVVAETAPKPAEVEPAPAGTMPASTETGPALVQAVPALDESESAAVETDLVPAEATPASAETVPTLAEVVSTPVETDPVQAEATPTSDETVPTRAEVLSALVETAPVLVQMADEVSTRVDAGAESPAE
eukprot:GEMP01005238.1.p1 GENE.GEMP01005238.1~~GEMP01005238.1.p1  ORF type:complete len:784 (-),score=162.58 GEMP01005238.1:1561-3912(-)